MSSAATHAQRYRRSAGAAIGVGVAIGVVVFYQPIADRIQFVRARHAVVRVAEEAPFRPSVLRISEAFAYRPAPELVRGEISERTPAQWKLLKVIATLKGRDASPETLHTLGVSLVLAHDPVEAVRAFERALQLAESSQTSREQQASLWNDLAVAHYEVARRGEARHYVLALDAAERSWSMHRTRAAAFTRAVLLEQLNLRDLSVAAWRTYLDTDRDSEWTREARQRMTADVRETAQTSFTPALRTKLIDACSRGDRSTARAIVSVHPKEARTLGEDELLPAWAQASVTRSPDETRLLQTLRGLSDALRTFSGESLLFDVVSAIEKTPARRDAVTAGVLEFGAGRAAYKKQRIDEAIRRLGRAEEQLKAVGNPLWLLANVYRAAMVYSANRYPDVLATVDTHRVAESLEHYHALRGIRGWVVGLAYAQTGHPSESVAAYETALDGFRAARELESVGATLQLRAETLDYMTATDEAWIDRMDGVELFRNRPVSARPLVWMNVAMAAVRDHLDYAADAVLREIIDDARRRHDAMWLSEGLIWQAVARSRMGAPFTAQDLETIHDALRQIAEPSIRARSEANLQIVTAEIRVRTAVAANAEKALDFYKSTGDRFNSMTALAQAASQRAAAADYAKADASLVSALTELERQASEVADPFMRTLFAERARTLFLLASKVQGMRGRPAAALWLSDRARQTALRSLLAPQERATPDIQAEAETLGTRLVGSVPAGVTIVYQDLQDEKLLTWVIRDKRLHFVATPVSVSTLLRDVDEFLAAIRNDRMEAVRQQGTELRRILLGSVQSVIAGTEPLVWSPPPALRGLPIGALYDGRQFLAESRPVIVTRALSTFAAHLDGDRQSARTALIALPSAGPNSAVLAGATEEALAIARLYPGHHEFLRGEDATPETFLHMAADYDVIHFGGHGRGDRRPLQNAIEFGSRKVRAFDVLSLQLSRRPLVVLGGCRTDDAADRATLSLASAFVAAGASGVIGSLWDVEDQNTAKFLTQLHENLARGVSPSQALHHTQQSWIQRERGISSWAAFQLQM